MLESDRFVLAWFLFDRRPLILLAAASVSVIGALLILGALREASFTASARNAYATIRLTPFTESH